MASWLTLKNEWEAAFGIKIYYEPPESIKLTYPCAIMSRGNIQFADANNYKYLKTVRYSLTYITKTINDPLADTIAEYDHMVHGDSYTSDHLYHHTYSFTQRE